MTKTEDIQHALKLLNEGYAKGLVDEARYIRDDARLRHRQAEIKAWKEGQPEKKSPGTRLILCPPGAPLSAFPDNAPAPPPAGSLADSASEAALIWGNPQIPAPPPAGKLYPKRHAGDSDNVSSRYHSDSAPRLPLARPRRRISREDWERRAETRSRVARNGALPHFVGGRLTLTEAAILAVVGEEVRRKGVCALAWASIAGLAGCSREAVKKAMRKAKRLALVSIEQRRTGWLNDTNLVRIVDAAWSRYLTKPQTPAGSRRNSHGGTGVPAPRTEQEKREGFATREPGFPSGKPRNRAAEGPAAGLSG